MINLRSIILHRLHMNLNNPFTTSFGTVKKKDFFIIEAVDQSGKSGYGETVAFTIPWYTEETTETVFHMIQSFLIPILQQNKVNHPQQLMSLFHPIKRNNMAKAAVEGAIWDLYAKLNNITLSDAIGGTRKNIDVGISLGIESNPENLLQKIKHYVNEGYKRIKIKVKRDYDLEILKIVRQHFPTIPLMVDANSAYTLNDIEHLKQFDQFNLMMIEQPLASDDIFNHAIVQKQMKTPICLDESIHSLTDVKLAIELGSCKIINVKVGRVGGLSAAKEIHDYCQKHQIEMWVGGMLDAGVGRAHNIALATLSNFTLPGDIGASAHYWEQDIITPEVSVQSGIVQISNKLGIGYELNKNVMEQHLIERKEFLF